MKTREPLDLLRRLGPFAALGVLWVLPLTWTLCAAHAQTAEPWQTISAEATAELNADLRDELPTVDVGIYYPSNLDESFRTAVPVAALLDEFAIAKDILMKAGVQIRLLWVRSGPVAPGHLSIPADDRGEDIPNDGYANMYVHAARHPTSLSREAQSAFEAIVEPDPDNHRTIYLIALQSVYMSYFESDDNGRNWSQRLVRTEGMSFPGYLYGDKIPRRLRGVITLSGTRDNHWKRTAHELGHKLMNVSHEYMATSPQHEIKADGGLMLYGKGTEIASGEAGRWHRERLHLSPYIYRQHKDGKRVWNEDYREAGFYYDSLYGNKSIRFPGSRETSVFNPGDIRVPN